MGGCCSKKQSKPLLILDLNNVLVYREYQDALAPEQAAVIPSAVLIGKRLTWKRPHVDEFLEYIFSKFNVAVWSSAMQFNVDLQCEFVFGDKRKQLVFEWDQSKCLVEPRPGAPKPLFIKPLQKIWSAFPQFSAEDTIIVDDSMEKMKVNPSKCVLLTEKWVPVQDV